MDFVKVVELRGIRTSTPATVSEPVGEASPVRVDDLGRLWVRVEGDLRVTSILSGSTDGEPIALGTGPTTIHTVASGTATFEQVWLYLSNTTGTVSTVDIYWGAEDADHTLPYQVGAYSTILAVAGSPLTNGNTVSALASVVGVNVTGYVETVSS